MDIWAEIATIVIDILDIDSFLGTETWDANHVCIQVYFYYHDFDERSRSMLSVDQ